MCLDGKPAVQQVDFVGLHHQAGWFAAFLGSLRGSVAEAHMPGWFSRS
jgi:hypothetical protein